MKMQKLSQVGQRCKSKTLYSMVLIVTVKLLKLTQLNQWDYILKYLMWTEIGKMYFTLVIKKGNLSLLSHNIADLLESWHLISTSECWRKLMHKLTKYKFIKIGTCHMISNFDPSLHFFNLHSLRICIV